MRVPRTCAALWLAAAAALLPAGCSSTPPKAPPPVYSHAAISPAEACGAYANESDGRTYVYLVNGADPFKWAGLDRLAERIRKSGYPRTRYGEAYDINGFEKEIRRVHAEDPSGRFVLIGFSYGTLLVRSTANALLRDGIPVAMVGYIGGDYLTDKENSRPGGVAKIVNVRGNGFLLTGRNLFWNGTDLTGATNERLAGVNHFGLPMNPRTWELIGAGLAEVSAGH